jgi:NADPH-dependent curcumin reductase CurA
MPQLSKGCYSSIVVLSFAVNVATMGLMGSATMVNRQILLASRPKGIPQPHHFRIDTRAMPEVMAGQILVENHFLSIDPAQRGYVNDENNYSPPVPVGDVMRSLAVGRVITSRHPDIREGSYVYGWFGWQEFCVCGPESIFRRVDPNQASLSAAAGVLGINGLTARLALREIGVPKAGETIVVTAGAGAVGSIVGQLATLAGCRAVAVVGSDEKGAQCIEQFGFAAFVNYKRPWLQPLRDACPTGVDVFFDNVGGALADAIVREMNLHGRVVICGTLATAQWVPAPIGPRIEREILTRRLRIGGFVVFDHVSQFDSVAAELATLLADGKLRIAEDIEFGLENAPRALVDVYAGRNHGKKLISLRG